MLDNVNGMREAQDIICVALSIKKQTSHKKLYALMESMHKGRAQGLSRTSEKESISEDVRLHKGPDFASWP